jgi:hypothetical protein
MKRSNTWFALILIASALLLNVAQCVNAEPNLSALPTRAEQKQQTTNETSAAQRSTVASEIPLTSQTATPNDEASQTPEQSGSRWFLSFLWKINWSNWALVFAAIWAARIALSTLKSIESQGNIAVETLKAMKRSADAEERDLILTHRAALGIKGIDFKLTERCEATIQVENFGRSAANKIRIKTNAEKNTAAPDAIDWRRIVPTNEGRLSDGEMMPGVAHQISVAMVLPDEQIRAVQNKLLFLYLAAHISYDDGFGNDQTLLVKAVYNADSAKWQMIFE